MIYYISFIWLQREREKESEHLQPATLHRIENDIEIKCNFISDKVNEERHEGRKSKGPLWMQHFKIKYLF